ncbi:MAG: hypothetical protein WCP04_08310 [Pseudomonadota bacterium]
MINTEAQRSRSWFQVPFMWLVVAIPLITVIAGLSTVVIAYRNHDALVQEDRAGIMGPSQHQPLGVAAESNGGIGRTP